jgi:hypothetical protein
MMNLYGRPSLETTPKPSFFAGFAVLCEPCAMGIRSRKRDTLAQSSQRTAKHASGFFMLSARYFEHGYSVGAPRSFDFW